MDTNVIAYLCLRGERTDAAETLRARDADWHAPLLWRSEFANVLAGQMRQRGLSLRAAQDAMAQAERQMEGRSHAVASTAVLDLIGVSACSAYDLEFVALAQELRVPLVTLDRQVLKAFPNLAVALPQAVIGNR